MVVFNVNIKNQVAILIVHIHLFDKPVLKILHNIAQRIFNFLVHLHQIQLLAISKELREFFSKNFINSIKFWDCPNNDNWTIYSIVDKETKIQSYSSLSI